MQLDLFKNYEQILVFVQKTNDLDTCCGALSIIEILRKLYPDKKYLIVGLEGKSLFLPQIKNYKVKTDEVVVTEKTIAVLSEVSSPKQIKRENLKLLEQCETILKLDHHKHNEVDKLFEEPILSKIEKYEITKTDYGSLCEVIWDLAKEHKWELDKQIAEYLFLGLYSDNLELKDPDLRPRTLEIVLEIANYGVNVGHLMREFSKFEFKNFSIFSSALSNSTLEGNLLVINLNAQMAYDKNPALFFRDKNGKLRQKTMFTCVLTLAQKMIRANTYLFIHYSLFDPLNTDKKFVYVALHKENKELEELLKSNEFILNKGRWSRAIQFHKLMRLIQDNLEIFTK